MGESPVLYASGFHHPALSETVVPVQDNPIIAIAYREYIITQCRKLQGLFVWVTE